MTESSRVPSCRFAPDADWPAWQSASGINRTAIHVLRIWLPDRLRFYSEDLSLLSLDEQARAARFLIEIVRQRFVACRAVVRRVLAQLLALTPAKIAFDYGEHGKPQLAAHQSETGLAFNVSHSADVALVALGWNCDLGVDVEARANCDRRGLAQRFFAPAEWQQIERLPAELQPAAFYRVWSCKEAYLKATGCGMSLPLGRFVVCADPRLPARLIDAFDRPADVARWRSGTVDPAIDYAGAVLWDGPATAVQRWTWNNVPAAAE